MGASDDPSAIFSHVHRADGSATFSQNGYTVVGACNGPIEVTRRDEIPEEAALDVNIRPAAGAGGIRERHLELILQATLRQIIHIQNFPRTLIQMTLQVTATPQDDTGSKIGQNDSLLPILPALLQTAVLALLSASMPMAMTLTAVLIAVKNGGFVQEVTHNPSLDEIRNSNSLHVLAFTSRGELLVAESEGSFTMDQWDDVFDKAKLYCGDAAGQEKVQDGMETGAGDMTSFLKSTLQTKVSADLHWKFQNR